MDKNKSRTDLLAAGRKKLQQFRQKKDNKGSGSHGKSTKNFGNSEQHEADAVSSATERTALPQAPEVEAKSPAGATLENINSSGSHSGENSMVSDINVAAPGSAAVPITHERSVVETLIDQNAESPSQEAGVSKNDVDLSVRNEEESTGTADAEAARVISLDTSHAVDSGGQGKDANMSIPVDVSVQPASVDFTEGMRVAVETESLSSEEGSLPSQESVNTALMQVREDQEADGLDVKKSSHSHEAEFELKGDNRLSSSELDTSVESSSGQAPSVDEQTGKMNEGSDGILVSASDAKQSNPSREAEVELDGDRSLSLSELDRTAETFPDPASSVDEQPGKADEASVSDPATMYDGLSVSALALPEAVVSLVVSPVTENQQKSEDGPGSYFEEKSEVQVGSGFGQGGEEHRVISEDYHQKHLSDGSKRPLETNMVSPDKGWTACPAADDSAISLSQLTKVITRLSEEEFRILLKSIQSVSNTFLGTTNLIVPEYGFSESFERLKEELILSNFTKDIFHLQLAQQSEMQVEFDCQREQLLDETSLLHASLNEVREKNQFLAEELAGCRCELQAVASGREELQNQFQTAKAEVEDFSARSIELQSSLERSRLDLSRLSAELSDCKSLVETLQVENEKLNGTIASSDENRKKLVEQNDIYLQEKEKLSADLVDCERSAATLQGQISNLSGILGSVTEEKQKLEEEEEHLSSENEKLAIELAESKNLVLALQVENGNLNGSLTLVTEERKKLEEEEYSSYEIERLSSELLVRQERLSAEHGEHMRVEVDLKETTACLEQLTEENIFLSSSLDILKAKMGEVNKGGIKILDQVGEAGNQVEISELQSRSQENATQDQQVPGKEDSEVSFIMVEKPLSDCCGGGPPFLNIGRREVFDDSFGFVALKGHLEEADKILNKLVEEIEGICSHSESLNRSNEKVSTPPVSKLIQAYESKAHLEEHDGEGRSLTDNQSPEDSIVSVTEQTGNLRALFEQLLLDAANASVLLKKEQDGRNTANDTFEALKDQYEALEEHSKKLEATNIELDVLYEALEQHRGNLETRNNELVVFCESLQLQVTNLEAENVEVGRRLHGYESRISQLQSRLHDLHLSSNDTVSQISDQLENFRKEAAESVFILERHWNSTIAPVVVVIGKLDKSLGRFTMTTPVSHDCLDTITHFIASVYDAISFIEDLKEKLESSQTYREAICISYKEVNEKCDDLHGKNELAIDTLKKVYGNLRKLLRVLHGSKNESEMNLENEKLPDPLDYSIYETTIEQLENLLGERLQLQSVNKKLNSELMERTEELEELKLRGPDSSVIQKLIEDVEGVLKVERAEVEVDKMPASHLESLVSCLVLKYQEADVQVSLSKEGFQSKVMELSIMQEEIQKLNGLCLQHESETIVLKESLRHAEEALLVARSELQEKLNELEQSEQRVSSLREKLSIAVSKGKGLIVQRDGFKQSLTEKSSELERFLQELQLKDSRLLEVETKLKAYSEAGERVEALESELSYIRNSATALRESFLLKDSALQRIEEILEDLDLPEHFHLRDIIEKIDWLARSATGNTFPQTDSDQKSSARGGSFSDAGFGVMDSWKDDVQPSLDSGDDFKRKYDELQSEFYGLAEQNEMLEQSLMERNNLVQRLEELLDRIDMPSHLRSMEPEERIEWLRKALSEVQGDNMSLQEKVVNLENDCVSLTVDLEDSGMRISDLEADLQTCIDERNNLSQRLEVLISDHDKLSAKAAEFEPENEKLQEEVADLQENIAKKCGNEKQIFSIEGDIKRLQSLVTGALQDPVTTSEYSGESSIECLEGLLNKLLENYATLSTGKPVFGGAADGTHIENSEAMVDEARSISTPETAESDIAVLKKELEEVQREILDVKEERDGYLEKQRSLACESEALNKKVTELQGLLNQEEQKSASVREKLNVAVRKGKQLVQQRDSLKQNIEEINSEVERLRSEIKIEEGKLAEYEQKFRDLSDYPGRVEALESESLFLRNCLKETEHNFHEKGNTLSLILNVLGNIDVGDDANSGDPVLKMEQIGIMCSDLRVGMASSEQEARKSKRAAELLLAELNEVQERNDGLQEELAKSASELAMLSKERDIAEAAKLEALLHLEKLSTAHSEERKNQFSEFSGLKSGVDQLRKGFHDVSNLLTGVFHQDLDILHNLESGIDSCLKASSAAYVVDVPLCTTTRGFIMSKSDEENFISMNSWSDSNMQGHFDDNFIIEIFTHVRHYLQEAMMQIGVLKEKLDEHSISLHEKASSVSKLMAIVRGELNSKNESFEALKRHLSHMERVENEKDKELLLLRRNIALLFEACTDSVMETGRRKAELVGNGWAAGDMGMRLSSAEFPVGGLSLSGEDQLRSEECVRTIADRLLSTVSEFGTLTAEIVEGSQKELKITISKLQKELQMKDIQKERICTELVSQIKGAEAAAKSYSQDLQSSKTLVHELEKRIEVMKGERDMLEQRVKELEDGRATSTELQERVRSLTNAFAAKEQEIEDLMQALDDEEVQLQGLTSRIKELEKVVEQKNLDLENLETSRGKVMKKLSVTVSKFDELHDLSASLLAEVEKLQSQLQDRDAEISFLRQEVTRCTNDVLVASQICNKRNSDEILGLLTWFDMNIARVGVHNAYLGDENIDQVSEHMEIFKKKIDSVISEVGNLQAVAQRKDTLLQVERSKVEELTRKGETLEKSLHEKESRLYLLEGVGDSGRGTSTSEIIEVEPVKNNWAVSGTSIAPQVRSLRKGNSDQVAIAIDMDSGSSSRLEDEDDDKVHGFKSLTTSRIVPRFTRPVTDMVDGLWVSCDRTLMRKPALRLGIILYWAILHALVATFAI